MQPTVEVIPHFQNLPFPMMEKRSTTSATVLKKILISLGHDAALSASISSPGSGSVSGDM